MPLSKIGGAKEDRTPDLLNAIQALSQLSYNPESNYSYIIRHFKSKEKKTPS